MFRLRLVNPCLRRLLHGGTANKDLVLEQLQCCSVEDQVLALVGKNKAKLTVDHVGCAVTMLWQFQTEKPELLRTVELINSHPQFLTLRVLAENKIAQMDDQMLVDILYSFLRLNVEHHDSLVQQLVSEAWLRLDRLPMDSLSKFAICLVHQHLAHSPLLGQIANIAYKKLSSITDARILSALMTSTSLMVSPRLRDAFIGRADQLLDTSVHGGFSDPRRVVQFLDMIKYHHRPLLEKCNRMFLGMVPVMNAENIGIILAMYQSLQFHNCDLKLAMKQRLIELIDSSTDPRYFTRLFGTLAPMASPEIITGLENTALLLADELDTQQALVVAETLVEIRSRNLRLINKIASVIQRHLHVYHSVDLVRVTRALYQLHYQNPELFTKLRHMLLGLLQRSITPDHVTMLTRVLCMLPSSRIEDVVMSRVEDVAAQCNLGNISTISYAVGRSIHYDDAHRHSVPSQYARLLQTLKRCGQKRLQTADRLDLLLVQLRAPRSVWFEEILFEDTMDALRRMMDQVNWSNVPELGLFLARLNVFCPPLMDRMASEVIKDIEKVHYSAIYTVLLPFIVMNYDSDELFDVCIQHFLPHIHSFDPHQLVFLANILAVAEYFPEELAREIMSVNFLRRLDAHLETLPDSLNLRTRRSLMEFNRAVCLECPEFQVPWFHAGYCQQTQYRGKVSPVYQQVHRMLDEVLGGINFVRASVVTPYGYTVDFECTLDKNLKPLPYTNLSSLQILNDILNTNDRGKTQGQTRSLDSVDRELPPGAHRVAVDLLSPRFFCKDSHHETGSSLARKRHLEILGYRVVQIPHFEWNSMELSSQNARTEYLKKKIFTELSS